MVGKLVGSTEILHGRVIFRQAVLCKLYHTGDTVHRGSYFVRHTEKEACFELTCLFGVVETSFILLLPLVLLGDIAENQQICGFVAALLGREEKPKPVLCLKLKFKGLAAVKGLYFFQKAASSS